MSDDKKVSFLPGAKAFAPVDMEEALKVIDDLKDALASGRIKAFIGVGIAPSHESFIYATKTGSVSVLEAIGATNWLAAATENGMLSSE